MLVDFFTFKSVSCNLRELGTTLELPSFNLECMHKSLRPFIGGSHQIYLVICKVIRVAQRTEDWRASLDRREAFAVVAVDQNKAFDSGGTPHMKGVGMLVGNFELNS